MSLRLSAILDLKSKFACIFLHLPLEKRTVMLLALLQWTMLIKKTPIAMFDCYSMVSVTTYFQIIKTVNKPRGKPGKLHLKE
jgi:hypothetical protein